MTTPAKEIGARVVTFRKGRDMTQTELAAGMASFGWTRDTVAAVETGRRDLHLTEAVALTHLLDCSIAELIEGVSLPTPEPIMGSLSSQWTRGQETRRARRLRFVWTGEEGLSQHQVVCPCGWTSDPYDSDSGQVPRAVMVTLLGHTSPGGEPCMVPIRMERAVEVKRW